MTLEQLINGIFTLIASIGVAIIGYYTARAKKRDEQRRKVDECIMGMTAANSDALLIVLKHLHGEELDGDVEHAIETIESEVTEYSKVRDKVVANL